jgi:riboflavin kinase/FMN adenylyltransferase
MAMTFDPHPPRVVRPDKAPPLLMTKTQRLEALIGLGCVRGGRAVHARAVGVGARDLRAHGARDWLRVSEVWVGANFLFGHGRSGNFSLLRTLGQQHGFRADKIDPVRYKDFVVSSTRIRRLVTEARMDEAGALLGHPYFRMARLSRDASGGSDWISDGEHGDRERADPAARRSMRRR